MHNHYQTLGLDTGAPADAIQQAYHRALHRFHRYQQQGTPLPEAEFDALQNAYDCLRDPARKAAYDATLPATPSPALAPPAPPFTTTARFSAATAKPARHAFEFTGSGGEYFRIWIVNLLLTFLTLGIYSAWAKVRREQYFHRNTLLDGSGFDYHGNPQAILKGRAIAWLLLLILTLMENIAPLLYPIALLLLMPVVPWLMQRSFIFRARNTSYRGLRFDFHGTYKEACKVFLGYGLLTLVTFGLAMPAFLRRIKQFQLNNLSFGGEHLECTPALGAFFGVFLRSSLIAFVPLLAVSILAGIILAGSGMDAGGDGTAKLAMAGGLLLAIGLTYVVVLAVVQPYLQCRLANLVWNNTRLGAHTFHSDQGFKSLFAVFISNWLLTLVTLGLYWPWAKVKLADYRARHTSLEARGSLDDFIGQALQQRQAVGEEIADAFDLDIAI